MNKGISITILSVVLVIIVQLLVVCSCKKEEGIEKFPDKNSRTIIISGVYPDITTKTTLSGLTTSWSSGTDRVGVYCAQSTGGNTNVEYIATGSGSSATFSGGMKWGTGEHSFYAYYPYSSGTPSVTAVPISLSASQTQTASGNNSHVGSLDFMVATPVTGVSPGTEGSSTNVNLRYNHVFSILEFKLISASPSGKITKIKLTATGVNLSLSSGTIDITQPAPGAVSPYTLASAVGTKEIVLTITGGVTLTSDSNTTPSIYMMILPGDHSVENMTIGVETDNQGFYSNYAKTGKSFLRGTKYIVQLNLDNLNPWAPLEPVTINHTNGAGGAYVGNITWAPVNAGYDATHKYGLLFQWGRKYGQGRIVSESTLVAATVDVATGNALSNATNFYYSSTLSNWCSPAVSSWDNNPCPNGWRVPTDPEITALSLIPRTWTESGGPDNLPGMWFGIGSDMVFLPGGGDRLGNGSFVEQGVHSDIWSSTPFGAGKPGKAHCFDYYRSVSDGRTRTEEDDFISGNSVRCVKK